MLGTGLALLLIVTLVNGQQYQQKVAPGVPPKHYQQPPPPQQQFQQPPQQQQFQQPPPQQQQQFQQPPPQQQQQYQQPPPQQQQQFQQPPPQQQQPTQQHPDAKVLNTVNIAQEREHIQEHMDVPIDTSKMSEQELQFHYFKMHDADNNNKLDGCELIKSLIHWHDHNDSEEKQQKIFTDEELRSIVDEVMKRSDHNDDGYVDFYEYKQVDSDKK